MYKTVLLSIVLSLSLYADAKKYVGVSFGTYSEKFTNKTNSSDTTSLTTLKVGYGDHKAYSIEFSLQQVKQSSNNFSKADGNKYAFNVELIKAFDFDTFINPFFKVGFGTGRVKLAQTTQNTLYSGSFNLAVGSYLPLTDSIDLEVGYNYRYISYEKFEEGSSAISYKSRTKIIYGGLNFRF